MRYKIEKASGEDFDIEWGNFSKRKHFEKDSCIFSLKVMMGYFQATKETYIREGKSVKYVYGHYGQTPKEIYDKCLKSFKDDGRIIKFIDSDTFQLGTYKYSIEINSLDNLQKLIDQFDVRLIFCEEYIIIYDGYVE